MKGGDRDSVKKPHHRIRYANKAKKETFFIHQHPVVSLRNTRMVSNHCNLKRQYNQLRYTVSLLRIRPALYFYTVSDPATPPTSTSAASLIVPPSTQDQKHSTHTQTQFRANSERYPPRCLTTTSFCLSRQRGSRLGKRRRLMNTIRWVRSLCFWPDLSFYYASRQTI